MMPFFGIEALRHWTSSIAWKLNLSFPVLPEFWMPKNVPPHRRSVMFDECPHYELLTQCVGIMGISSEELGKSEYFCGHLKHDDLRFIRGHYQPIRCDFQPFRVCALIRTMMVRAIVEVKDGGRDRFKVINLLRHGLSVDMGSSMQRLSIKNLLREVDYLIRRLEKHSVGDQSRSFVFQPHEDHGFKPCDLSPHLRSVDYFVHDD